MSWWVPSAVVGWCLLSTLLLQLPLLWKMQSRGSGVVLGSRLVAALVFQRRSFMAQSHLLSFKGALHGHHLILKQICGSIVLAFPRQGLNLWFSDNNLMLRVLVVLSYTSELCLGNHCQIIPGRCLSAFY